LAITRAKVPEKPRAKWLNNQNYQVKNARKPPDLGLIKAKVPEKGRAN
jgi:hypothetical protein